MTKRTTPDIIMDAFDALTEIEGVCHHLGAAHQKLRRCRVGSKRWRELDAEITMLSGLAVQHRDTIQKALHACICEADAAREEMDSLLDRLDASENMGW